jgi:hypothetical protein
MSYRLRALGRTVALVVALFTLYTSSGNAQITRSWAVAQAPLSPPVERGWMGINVEVTVLERERGPANIEVRVVGTVDGSPAAEAGVVFGDVLRGINGELLTIEGWQVFTQNLRPGVDLRLALEREGRGREVRLTTATRPSLPPVPVGLTDHLDSVRTSFRIQLESNKGMWASRDYVAFLMASGSVEEESSRILAQTRQNAVSYGVRAGSVEDLVAPSRQSSNRYSLVWNTDAALPFEYLMLQSPEADSVKTAIIGLRGTLSQVIEATRVREREIREIVQVRVRELGDADAQLLRLRSDNEQVQEDLERLAIRLVEIGSNERETRMRAAGPTAESAVQVRPVTAYVVGRNFVGGAQLNDLNPQLGTYFGTDRGVLVIQVLSGTPSDEAGLVPGDVVTHVGDTEIDSVEGFRTGLNRVLARRRQADLTLVRRGERVTATLSR